MSRRQAAANRSRMPGTAAEIDAWRRVFGAGARVLYATENGLEVGARPDHGLSMSGAQWIHFLATGELP